MTRPRSSGADGLFGRCRVLDRSAARPAHRRAAIRSAASSINLPTGCSPICVAIKPVDTRSTTPPLLDGRGVGAGERGEQAGAGGRVADKQVGRVLTHDHAEVVLGFGEQAVRVHELVGAIPRVEGVPLVDVAVHEHRAVIVVRGRTPLRARQRVIDRALRARPACQVPPLGDPIDEPAGFFGAVR